MIRANLFSDRTPSSSHAHVSWYHDFRALDDKFILRHSSLEAYLFLRYLRIIVLICVVGCCLTWPILFAVNATGGGDSTQLDRISFSNVRDPKRLYAHAVVAAVFLGSSLLLHQNSNADDASRVRHSSRNKRKAFCHWATPSISDNPRKRNETVFKGGVVFICTTTRPP